MFETQIRRCLAVVMYAREHLGFSPAYAVFDAENGRQLAAGLANDIEQAKESALSVARAKLAKGFGTDFK